jgi:phosphate transport system permease protein
MTTTFESIAPAETSGSTDQVAAAEVTAVMVPLRVPPDGPPPASARPQHSPDPAPVVPRRIGGARTSDVYSLLAALAAALCTAGLWWVDLAPFNGVLGFVVVSWVLFVAFYGVLVSFDEKRTTVIDRIVQVVVTSLAFVVFGSLALVIFYTVEQGWRALVHVNFYTQDLRTTAPNDPLSKGGVFHALVGTLIELGITLAFAVPLGVLGAVFLAEVPGRFNRFVRTIVEAMTALPDILAGLFVYATLILILGTGFCGFAASVALAITILPIIMRTGDIVLRLVAGNLKEASYALGTSQWRTVWHVTLPTARAGLATAVILGAARAIGETSPVLLTAGFNTNLNTNAFSGPMVSLPLEVYQDVATPQHTSIERGFGTATLLLVLVVVLFTIARILGGRGPGELSRRQQHRRVQASQRDVARMDKRRIQPEESPRTNPPGRLVNPVHAGAADPSGAV